MPISSRIFWNSREDMAPPSRLFIMDRGYSSSLPSLVPGKPRHRCSCSVSFSLAACLPVRGAMGGRASPWPALSQPPKNSSISASTFSGI